MYYTIYKTINNVNNKEYVGFHKIRYISDIKSEKSENGSIFEDGYLGSGVLMKKALEKYGPMNMSQELILLTDDKEEAEHLEREMVSREWVESDDNYNISLGGNVCILFGEKNGFYGRKHTDDTINKIQESRKKAYENQPFSWSRSFLVEDNTVVFYNSKEICDYFGVEGWYEVNRLVYEGKIQYYSEYLQNASIKRFLNRYNFLNDEKARLEAKQKLSILAHERFAGKPKSEESNEKRGKSIKRWIENNPDKHSKRMEKINKNPEKIEKTASRHRGMKRSKETCENISKSLKGKPASNRGKIWIHNKNTGEKKYIERDSTIPDGWEIGMGRRK